MGFGASAEQLLRDAEVKRQGTTRAGETGTDLSQIDALEAEARVFSQRIIVLEKATSILARRMDQHETQLDDHERCIKGQAEELTKTNARMDALVADREKHQRRLDDRLEEVIESTQEAEKAFLIRIERAEKKRDAAYGEIAKLKRAAKGDQD